MMIFALAVTEIATTRTVCRKRQMDMAVDEAAA
jgi:hypothetical protein